MVNKRITATLTTTLVIVESPSKCKKIEEYLGPGYKCLASFGHLRELPSLNHIDFTNDFKPTYTISESKVKQVSLLKKEIALAGEVVLATDDDREGEAIAWHICMIFDLNPALTKRIIFHEITETALQHAIRNPTRINMNIVYAQQARQILDLLVGFKISPLLWKHISHQSLSAGRCQSPALKLIYDNQQEIERNPGKKIYNTSGFFQFSKAIPFDLNKHHETEDDMIEFLDACASFSHTFVCTQPSKVYKQPPTPLNTSRIQQASSNELHISPKETMKLCQALYEAGYITYMRTESQTYCTDFLNQVQKYIIAHYDESHILKREKPPPAEGTAEKPHEAIRPTDISLIKLPDKFSSKEQRMYKLIWETTLESCMSPAEFYSIKATIQAPMKSQYTHTSEKLSFLGWMAVNNRPQSREEEERNYNILCNHQNPNVKYAKIQSKLTMKDTKQHYTEAKLVLLLEEKGIGRPSTFSMLVEKIQEREYVKKQNVAGKSVVCKDFELEGDEIFEIETTREFGNEHGKLVIQPLGVIVIDFLEKYFAPLFDYNYTKKMEDALDTIAGGSNVVWQNICKDCLGQIEELTYQLTTPNTNASGKGTGNATGSGVGKVEYKIDDQHSYIIGKNGPVIKCTNKATNETTFKSVKDNIDVHKLERGEYSLEDILSTPTSPSSQSTDFSLGQYEGHDIFLKRGKFGIYAAWGTETHSLKCFGNRPIENINYADVVEVLQKSGNVIRKINDDMSIRSGKRGNYIFYKTAKMRKPQFLTLKDCALDYAECEVSLIRQWIHDTYSI
jgi:DNA topoisomerase-1